jgi:hypothetical protein
MQSDTTFAIAKVAGEIHTIGGARAALGAVSEMLRDGYTKLPEIAGSSPFSELAFRTYLDTANARAQELYAIYAGATPDLFDEEISLTNAGRIGFLLESTRKVLTDIEAVAARDYWDIAGTISRAVALAQKAIEWTAGLVGKSAAAIIAPILKAFWPVLLIVGVVLAVYLFRDRIFKGQST